MDWPTVITIPNTVCVCVCMCVCVRVERFVSESLKEHNLWSRLTFLCSIEKRSVFWSVSDIKDLCSGQQLQFIMNTCIYYAHVQGCSSTDPLKILCHSANRTHVLPGVILENPLGGRGGKSMLEDVSGVCVCILKG